MTDSIFHPANWFAIVTLWKPAAADLTKLHENNFKNTPARLILQKLLAAQFPHTWINGCHSPLSTGSIFNPSPLFTHTIIGSAVSEAIAPADENLLQIPIYIQLILPVHPISLSQPNSYFLLLVNVQVTFVFNLDETCPKSKFCFDFEHF